MTNTGPLVAVPLTPARTTGVSAWVDIVKPAALLAEQIAPTDFVPKAMRDNPPAVTACILFGAEIGIGPMQALAKIAIIDGKPAPSAELARALVLSDGHDMWVEEANTTRVIMGGKRANSTHVQKVTWTMDDAKKAGLNGKQNWQRYPRQMLLARASIELARMIAPDSLGGISVFAEELDDGPVGLEVVADTATPAPARKVQTRRLATVAAPEGPPLPGEESDQAGIASPPDAGERPGQGEGRRHPSPPSDEASVPPLPDEEPSTHPGGDTPPREGPTDAQIRKLMVEYNRLGVKDRHDQKRITAGLLDLPELGSHKDLSPAQTSILIDMLVALDPFTDIVRVDNLPYVAGSEPDAEQEPML